MAPGCQLFYSDVFNKQHFLSCASGTASVLRTVNRCLGGKTIPLAKLAHKVNQTKSNQTKTKHKNTQKMLT